MCLRTNCILLLRHIIFLCFWGLIWIFDFSWSFFHQQLTNKRRISFDFLLVFQEYNKLFKCIEQRINRKYRFLTIILITFIKNWVKLPYNVGRNCFINFLETKNSQNFLCSEILGAEFQFAMILYVIVVVFKKWKTLLNRKWG